MTTQRDEAVSQKTSPLQAEEEGWSSEPPQPPGSPSGWNIPFALVGGWDTKSKAANTHPALVHPMHPNADSHGSEETCWPRISKPDRAHVAITLTCTHSLNPCDTSLSLFTGTKTSNHAVSLTTRTLERSCAGHSRRLWERKAVTPKPTAQHHLSLTCVWRQRDSQLLVPVEIQL